MRLYFDQQSIHCDVFFVHVFLSIVIGRDLVNKHSIIIIIIIMDMQIVDVLVMSSTYGRYLDIRCGALTQRSSLQF